MGNVFGDGCCCTLQVITTELITNCLKRAFPDRKAEVRITLHTINGIIKLRIADNSVDIPEGIDFRTTKTLRLHLVTILAEDQLNGKIKLVRNEGTEFCIIFKTTL